MRRLLPIALSLVAGASVLATGEPADELRRRAYLQADEVFGSARLYKPSGVDEESLAYRMAPLIVLERGATMPSSIVRFAEGRVSLGGAEYRRLLYTWSVQTGGGTSEFRLTMVLDDEGFPMIWEAKTVEPGIRRLFVSTELEAAAMKHYDGPLPGRLWAVEPSTGAAPDVVVPRTIEPGPVPLGPFVYVRSGTREITTVLCRCMPQQVDAISESLFYTVGPAEPGDLSAAGSTGYESKLRLP